MAESENTPHRGRTGEREVVLLAFYAGGLGVPLTVSLPGLESLKTLS